MSQIDVYCQHNIQQVKSQLSSGDASRYYLDIQLALQGKFKLAFALCGLHLDEKQFLFDANDKVNKFTFPLTAQPKVHYESQWHK